MSQLSNEKNPLWERKKVFLKVLVAGKASLYSYDSDVLRFFYSIDNKEIKQLIWKEYLVDGSVATNNAFRQQLVGDVNCGNSTLTVTNLHYYKKALVKYFQQYNKCVDPNYAVEHEKPATGPGREIFNASIFLGINTTDLSVTFPGSFSFLSSDYGKNTAFTFGVESEFILPFQNNKWAVTTKGTYQQYSSKKEYEYSLSRLSLKFTNLDLGVRRYFFLTESTKVYIEGNVNILGYLVDGEYGYLSKTSHSDNLSYFDLDKFNFYPALSGFGSGLRYKKIGIDARYILYQHALRSRTQWYSDMKGVTLAASYRFVKARKKTRS